MRVVRVLTVLVTLVLSVTLLPGPASAAVAPVVSGISARTGPTAGGNFVLLHGTGFDATTTVRFGSVTSPRLESGNPEELAAIAPRHGAGRVHVTVVTSSGASAQVTQDVYEYVADPRPVVRSGTARTAPLVTFDRAGKVVLSCTSSTFCAAGGSRGVSTLHGTTWGGVTSLGDRRVRSISCTSSSFCMAGTVGGTVWRYDGTTWTLSATVSAASIEQLSCGAPDLCATGASASTEGRVAATWDGSAWSSRPSAAQGISCPTPTGCVSTDLNGFQLYSGGRWGPERLLYRSGFYESYAGGGALSCSSMTACLDGNGGSGGDLGLAADYTVYTGDDATWSYGLDLAASNRATGNASAVDCPSSTFCAVRQGSWEPGDPVSGKAAVHWWVVDGAARTPFSASYDAAVSCWAPYSCVLMSPRSWFPTRRG